MTRNFHVTSDIFFFRSNSFEDAGFFFDLFCPIIKVRQEVGRSCGLRLLHTSHATTG